MAPKAPKKANPEVPPPPPSAIEDMEVSHSLPTQVDNLYLFHVYSYLILIYNVHIIVIFFDMIKL